MRFSYSGELGALPCPKTIQISSDPNCFIFSMIISALWCPNKWRKLKLIAIFVFGNDSDCCSTAENKHFPLIKHPSGHKKSLCVFFLSFFFFTTRFFILPLFTDSVQYLPLVKIKKSANKTGNEGRKFLKRIPQSSLDFFFFLLASTFCDRVSQ